MTENEENIINLFFFFSSVYFTAVSQTALRLHKQNEEAERRKKKYWRMSIIWLMTSSFD
jgi:hypothetical protein